MTTSIDFGPLSAPLPGGERAALVPTPRSMSAARMLTSISMLFFGLLSTVAGVGGAVGVLRNASSGLTSYSNVIAPTAITLASVTVLIIGLRLLLTSTAGPMRESMAARLPAFAAANGLVYHERSTKLPYPGAIFLLPDTVDRFSRRSIRPATGRFFEFGEFVARIALSTEKPLTRTWGFIAIRLDRELPHMMLRSRLENRLSLAIPAELREQQMLSLEGDFDTRFTLYAPEEYERDALYVFTPDLMALFIDEAAPFDAEIVDDWLFVYSNAPFTALGAEVYERIFRIIDLVGGKTISQTARYADERVGNRTDNRVAAAGRRLRRGSTTSELRAILLVGSLIAATITVFWVISLLPGVKV